MESADRKGLPLRRLLFSADRFKDAAIRLGSRDVKTPFSRVSAPSHGATSAGPCADRTGCFAVRHGACAPRSFSMRLFCRPSHLHGGSHCSTLNAGDKLAFRSTFRVVPVALSPETDERIPPQGHDSSISRPR